MYENRHRGKNWDIAKHVLKEESRKRYGVSSFMGADEISDKDTKGNIKWGTERKRVRDEASRTGWKTEYIQHNEEYDWVHSDISPDVRENKAKKREVQSRVGRFKRKAMKHLEDVSRGVF